MIQEKNDFGLGNMRSVDENACIPYGAEGRTGLLLVSAGSALINVADEKFEGSGVAADEYSVLAIVERDTPGSQLELSKLLGKAPAMVVAAVDRLEARGLVERTRDPADRRRSRVTLTATGAKKLAECDTLADEAVAELLPGLDAAEIAQLKDLLSKGLHFGLPEWAETEAKAR
jgi:DNA-binding MarR family transcriptional regulator